MKAEESIEKYTEKEQAILRSFPREFGFVLSFANSKGGVGKTMTSCMVAYNLAKAGIKTLLIDTDKQGNSTKIMTLTKRNIEGEYPEMKGSFMDGIVNGNLSDNVEPIMENLDLIPAQKDTTYFARHLYLNIDNDVDRDYFLHDAIRDVQFDYDVVIIDTPPNSNEIFRNIALASDYIVVAYHPTESSTTGAEDFKTDVDELRNNPEYDVKLDILGVLPSLVKKNSRTEDYLLDYMSRKTDKYEPEDIFNNTIYLMERAKEFDLNGIQNNDTWDEYVIENYQTVAFEVLERILNNAEVEIDG